MANGVMMILYGDFLAITASFRGVLKHGGKKNSLINENLCWCINLLCTVNFKKVWYCALHAQCLEIMSGLITMI